VFQVQPTQQAKERAVTKSISEFSGEAGTVYIRQAGEGNDRPYEVWFEDFCILGDGDSRLEALRDAQRHTRDILALIVEAEMKITEGATAGAQGG
jgi:hypothetical protein